MKIFTRIYLLFTRHHVYISTTINTRYTMGKDKQIELKDANMRVRGNKRSRVKEVRRQLAAVERRDLSDTEILDEVLEVGLPIFEKKLGI